FFDGGPLEAELIGRLRAAFDRADFWGRHATTWAVLDAELMPWPGDGRELRARYAAGRAALAEALAGLAPAVGRAGAADAFAAAYRRHCWPVGGVADLRLAPFHLLATEG